MTSVTHQTDFRFLNRIAEGRAAIATWGCLFFSLLNLVETKAGVALTVPEKLMIYDDLVNMNQRSPQRGMRATCFVMDHEDVLLAAAKLLSPGLQAKYLCIERGSEKKVIWADSRTPPTDYIGQWSVKNGHSHFNRIDHSVRVIYDPYPQLPLRELMSIRVYWLG